MTISQLLLIKLNIAVDTTEFFEHFEHLERMIKLHELVAERTAGVRLRLGKNFNHPLLVPGGPHLKTSFTDEEKS